MAKPTITVGVEGDTRRLKRDIDKISSKKVSLNLDSKNFSAPLGKIKGDLGEFDKSLAASNARVLAFGASAGAIYAIQKALSETVKATIEVERQLAEVNVILGASEKQLGRFGNELFNIAKKTGRSFQDVALAGGELARQGLAMEETLKRTSDAMILARLSGLGVEASVNAITAALNGFRNAALDSTAVVDKLVAVDQAFAVSGADLAEALRRVGSTAEGAGVSLDELLGIVTAAQQITARGGAVIGNSFKTIFTRIQRPKVLEALDELGVKTKNAAGASLSATQILKNLAKTYDTLGQAQQAQIAELVGGVFQMNVLKASLRDLGGQYSVFASATNIASNASSEAAKRNALLNKTLSAGLNETLQNLTKLAAGVGKLTLEPVIKNVLAIVNKITESVNLGESESKGASIGKALLGGLGKFLSGPGLALAAAALFQLFNNLRKFAVDAFRTFSGLNASFKQQQQLQQGIVNILQQNPKILAQIQRGEISVESAAKSILGTYKNLNQELVSMNTVAQRLATTMAGAGASVGKVGGRLSVKTPKATGYVPNFADQGEVAAMALSGQYTKSQMANPRTKRGRVHDGQGGSFMATYNGHETKQDIIGPNGKKGTVIASPAMQAAARGFVPNFVRGSASSIAKDPKIRDAFKADGGKLGGKKEQAEINKWYRGGGQGKMRDEAQVVVPANLRNQVGIFTTGKSMSTRPTLDLTGAQTIKALGTSSPYLDDISTLKISNMVQGSTKNIQGKLQKDKSFDSVVETELRKPLQNITKAMLGGSAGKNDIPSPIDTWKSASEDTSGYPQFLGRIFEAAINSVLGVTPAKGGTWDYKKGDFDGKGKGQESLYKALFGADLRKLDDAKNIDAKRSGYGQVATRDSIAAKLGSTKGYRDMLNADVGKFLGAKKANGYVPNFFKPLGDALKRENKAGVTKSAMRVQKDRRLASEGNPFGLAVTNTRDEPRGLKDVLARGYVPNFARGQRMNMNAGGTAPSSTPVSNPSATLDDGKKFNLRVSKSSEKLADSQDKASQGMNRLFGITMLASMASGIFASATEGAGSEMKKTGAAINGLVSGASIAATVMMTIPGPVGVMLGAMGGVTMGLVSYMSNIDQASESFMKHGETLDANSAKLALQGNAIQGAQQALEALKAATESGDAVQLQAAQKNYAEALMKLEPSLRAQVAAAPDSAAKQTKLGEAAASVAKDKTETDAAAETNKILQEQLKSQAKERTMDSLKGYLKMIGITVGVIAALMAAAKVGQGIGAGAKGIKAAKDIGAPGGIKAFTAGMRSTNGIIGKVGNGLHKLLGVLGIVTIAEAGVAASSTAAATGLWATAAPLLALVGMALAVVQVIGTIGSVMSKFGGKIGAAGDFLASKFNMLGGIIDYFNARKDAKDAQEKLKSKYIKPGEEGVGGIDDEGMRQRGFDAKSLLDMIDPAKMTEENMQKLQRAGADSETALIEELERLGVSAEKSSAYIEGAGSQLYGLTIDMTNMGREAAVAAAATARLQARLDAQAAAAAAADRAIQIANKQAINLALAMNIMGKGIQAARKQADANQRGFMMEQLKGGANLAKQFQSSFASTRQSGNISKLQVNEKAKGDFDKARATGNKAIFDAVSKQKDVAKIFEKVLNNQGSPAENQLFQAINGRAQMGTTSQGAAGAAAAVNAEIMRQSGAGGALEGKKVEIPGLLSILADQKTAMDKAEQTRQHQLRLSELQTKLAQTQNKIDQEMGAGGGIKGFLDPKQMDSQADNFNNVVSDFTTASNRGDTVKTGQAAGNLLGSLNEFLGAEMMGEDSGAGGLKDLAQTGLEKSMKGRAFARADVLDQAAAETGNQDLAKAATELRNMDFGDAAATQIAAEFKRQQMPDNIAEMLNVQNQLADLQRQDIDANRRTADNTNTMANALTSGSWSQGIGNMLSNLPAPEVRGLGGIPDAIKRASDSMSAVATALNAAAGDQVRGDKIKDLGKERMKKAQELDEMVSTAQSQGMTGRRAMAIQDKIKEIGAIDSQMGAAAAGMSAGAREAMGPEFKEDLDAKAEQHRLLQEGGYSGVTSISDMGPTVARAMGELMQTPMEMQQGGVGDVGGLSQDEIASATDDMETLGTKKYLEKINRTQGKEAAIEKAQAKMRNLQRRITEGGSNRTNTDELTLRLATLEEMIKRFKTGDVDETQSTAELVEDVLSKKTINQTINITIPAGMSVTGKEETVQIRNLHERLDNLEGNAGAGEVGSPVLAEPNPKG